VVCTILSGALIGVNNTVYTELALGVSDAPRPVASAGYNFVRWFAAAAAPYFAPKIEEWTGSVRVPFAVAAVTVVLGALVVALRREALTLPAASGSARAEGTRTAGEPGTRHTTRDGVSTFTRR
jgi:MFS transporter, ACDE family, multidrug resistance protein